MVKLVYNTKRFSLSNTLIPIIATVIFLLFLFYDSGKSTFFIIVFIVIILYLQLQQIIKQFILYQDMLIIDYPISVFLKPKQIMFDEIDYIKFDENSGARKVPFLKVLYKELLTNKNPQKFSFTHDFDEIQKVIDKLRELGVKVEVNSDNRWQ